MIISRVVLFLTVSLYGLLLQVLRFGVLPFVGGQTRWATWKTPGRFKPPYARMDFRGATVVWLHASSLGEAKVLVRFLAALKRKHPVDKYVVTAATATGVAWLEKCTDDAIIAAGYLPFDTTRLMRRMIRRFGVSRVWLIETELWPSLLWVCRRAGIPVGIANARLEESSARTYRRWGMLFGPLLRGLDIVLAQDQRYAERFESLGVAAERVRVTGNIKGQVSVQRPSRADWTALRKRVRVPEDAALITVGCVHGHEAFDIKSAIERLKRQSGQWRWILVPRHFEDVPILLRTLGPGVTHVKEFPVECDWNVLLVEKFGVLEDLYRIADAAVIGGTFVNVGGHNVWEAAQFGIPVLWGPHFYEQRESCERLLEARVGFTAATGDELAEALIRVLRSEARGFIEAQTAFMRSSSDATTLLDKVVP